MPTNARKTRNRRDTRPRLSEAQLQAYRARQAAMAQPEVAAGTTATATREGSFSQWGRLDDEYRMIRADLVRLGIITGAMLVLIIALTFILR